MSHPNVHGLLIFTLFSPSAALSRNITFQSLCRAPDTLKQQAEAVMKLHIVIFKDPFNVNKLLNLVYISRLL